MAYPSFSMLAYLWAEKEVQAHPELIVACTKMSVVAREQCLSILGKLEFVSGYTLLGGEVLSRRVSHTGPAWTHGLAKYQCALFGKAREKDRQIDRFGKGRPDPSSPGKKARQRCPQLSQTRARGRRPRVNLFSQ